MRSRAAAFKEILSRSWSSSHCSIRRALRCVWSLWGTSECSNGARRREAEAAMSPFEMEAGRLGLLAFSGAGPRDELGRISRVDQVSDPEECAEPA